MWFLNRPRTDLLLFYRVWHTPSSSNSWFHRDFLWEQQQNPAIQARKKKHKYVENPSGES